MRTLIFLFFLSGFIRLEALENHFIYIQSESGKPFYLSQGRKVISSSASGWLIIPELAEGSYQFTLGFPKNEFPDYIFQFKVNKQDQGYLLRNLGEKGWALVNLQSNEMVAGMAASAADKNNHADVAISNDPFSAMLAAVVDDPTIREKPYNAPEEKKAVVVAPPPTATTTVVKTENKPVTKSNAPTNEKNQSKTVQHPPVKSTTAKPGAVVAVAAATDKKVVTAPPTDSLTVKDSGTTAVAPLVVVPKETKVDSTVIAMAADSTKQSPKPVSKVSAALAAGISKTYQNEGTSGIDLVYVDGSAEKSDTIRIFISKESVESPPPAVSPAKNEKPATSSGDPRFLDMAVFPKSMVKDSSAVQKQEIVKDTVASVTKKDSVQAPLPEAVVTNPNCKAVASDDDLFKLRKKIITRRDEDEMVMIALKEFKTKCYSTEKIRSLSYIFLTEKGKYRLLDAAYPYVYDPVNFRQLNSLFTDTYYINRFQALIQ